MRPNKNGRIIIGLTGPIAAGKSTAAAYLANHWEMPTLDADEVGHEILTEPDIIRAITQMFGEEVLQDGTIDRSRLAARVFGSEERVDALNRITHPAITEKIRQWIQAQEAIEPMLLIEAYGLLQSELKGLVNEVWVVGCDARTRVRRVMKRQGLTEAQAQARVQSQWPDERYRDAADVYLDGSGASAFLQEQLDQLMKRYGQNP